ncbi:LysE family translocator [Silicimonas algicola]|uniref:Threonine/homoserine/homoserine lactone efflux protein n=1 Tax=Silicimonas algicola TaxID=1826607 RepID=A0A316G5Y6_9RHOB|nr:LysE family translocator [Silicimonas algicola]AZQ69310.1 LysE family translocator [Silicimonas algicola]PWK56371.1 threonine/homoserine/homoserine lactone efflux protein [Silicimonas algicola]
MIDPILLLAFLPAALALNLTPGADMLFCLAQGTRGGPVPALAASAGISTGAIVHVTLAGLGLGALVAAHPAAFDAIRYAGVAYLLWLVWRTLRSPLGAGGGPAVRPSRAFRDGLVVNLTNPKVILFILAFVPQFVDPARPVLAQFLVLGTVIAAGGFVVNGLVGVFAGGIGRHMARDARIERILRIVTATVFGGLAVRLALEGRRA